MNLALVEKTPAYVFDLDVFEERCEKVKSFLGDITLTFSIKANPFLLNGVPEAISHVEVCSPGELSICKEMKVDPKRIIYSGVNKEKWDVVEAVTLGVDILTAESKLHVMLENEAVLENRKNDEEKRNVILRLSSGNQFGMSEEDFEDIIANKDNYPGLNFIGLHYYSGTQKKLRQIEKDLSKIDALLSKLKDSYNFVPELVEYGPGAGVEYFDPDFEEKEMANFADIASLINEFNKKYPVGIEMGRFLASGCGSFYTAAKDIKSNSDTNYVIVDGGIHHLKYHGQTMAMQIPGIKVLRNGEELFDTFNAKECETKPYMLCGSLCTVADILVREVNLPELERDDVLVFARCGAYSVTEGTSLFLSRTMPRIYINSKKDGMKLLRDFFESSRINISGGVL